MEDSRNVAERAADPKKIVREKTHAFPASPSSNDSMEIRSISGSYGTRSCGAPTWTEGAGHALELGATGTDRAARTHPAERWLVPGRGQNRRRSHLLHDMATNAPVALTRAEFEALPRRRCA